MLMKAPSQQTQRITGLQVSASALGQTIPYVFGHCRCPHKVIYYSNFQSHPHSSSKKSGTTYWYSVNADFLLGYGPFESLISCWENGNWYYADYGSQTITASGTGTQFNFTVTSNTQPLLSIMGVALYGTYNINYSDYADPFTTNAFNLTGNSYLPLYNAYFPLPNYGNISLSTSPYAYYNANPGDNGVVVVFPSSVTNPQVKIYYAQLGGNNAPPQSTSGKKGGGSVPYQVGGLVLERQLGSGASGNPIIYPEFSGDAGANIPLGSSAVLPEFNYEAKALFGLGNSAPVSTYTPGVAPGDPGQYQARTTSGDCNPADIIADLICSGNREPGDTNIIWQHGLGFSSYIPTTDAYWAYSRFGGILKDEPSISGTGSAVTDTYFRPTTFAQTGSGYQNPTNAYDNNPATYSLGTPDSSGNAVGCQWFGIPAGTVGNNTYLRVLNNCIAQVGGAGSLRYSIDNGSTWITMYTFQEQQGTTATRGLQIDSAIIPNGTAMANIIVRAESHPGDHTGGYCWSYIYEIYLDQVTYTGGTGSGSLGLTSLRNYCLAYNIFISGAIDSQQKASSLLEDFCAIGNCAPVFDGGALDLIPYCEVSNYGNGTSYVAPTASGPIFNLTSNDFLPVKDKAPVELTYDRAVDNFNTVQVGFKDARAQFTDNFIYITDSMDVTVQGAMNATQKNYPYVTNAETAQAVGYTALRRTLLVERKEYKFGLPGYWSTILSPMDFITLNEPTLSPYPIPVRIKTITMSGSKMDLQLTAEPFIYGASSPIIPGATGSAQNITGIGNINNDPGNVNTPIIFEAVPQLATSPQIWICVSGANAYWGGAIVWMSTNGGVTYTQVGIANGEQTMGVTMTSTYPNHADPDSTDSLYVDLTESRGQLFSVSSTQQAQIFPSVCYLNGGGTVTNADGTTFTIPYELVAYQVATLTAANKYEMGAITSTSIRRGCFNTPTASHSVGTNFSFLSDGLVVKVDLPNSLIGTTLYFKFTSFNTNGGNGQNLSDVTAYTFTPTGKVGWNQPDYTISPQPTVYQGKSGGWSGIDPNSTTWTNTANVYFPPFTATFNNGTVLNYAARDSGLSIFTVSGGGEVAYVTIYDPSLTGEVGSATLTAYADLNTTRWNTQGYIRVGICISQPLSGGGGSGGGGGTNGSTTISIPSTTRGNFQIAHGLGKIPTNVTLSITADGLIRFQPSPSPPWDATNVYLNASDDGLTGLLVVES